MDLMEFVYSDFPEARMLNELYLKKDGEFLVDPNGNKHKMPKNFNMIPTEQYPILPDGNPKLRVLVACESSAAVRNEFTKLGHSAISSDLLDTDDPSGEHYKGNVLRLIANEHFDLMIAHPPCTHLALSGAKHFASKVADGRQTEGIEFFMQIARAPINRICIENPKAIMTGWQPPSCKIQPWMFGHPEQKETWLWLKNLPPLQPTKIVYDEMMLLPKKERERIFMMPPGPDRWKERSKTYKGIAEALALQYAGQV